MLGQVTGLERLQEGVLKKLEENRERGRKMKEHRNEYKKLDERLSTLSDQISHDVMVPFTSKAFMPGQLIHTNQLMVLLGDNYFIESSAKHAREICSRRIDQCDKMLEELEKEMKLVEGWQSQTKGLREEGKGCKDITEECSEEELEEWRKKHRESLKREKQLEKDNKVKIETDDDLWQRLEELEVQEALEKEWEEEEEDEEVSEDYSDDGDLTDNDSEVDDGYHDRISEIASGAAKEALGRRVSFGPDQINSPTQEIRFKHSDCEPESISSSSNHPQHPGQIKNCLPSPSTSQEEEPKSILKPVQYNPADFVRPEPSSSESQEPVEPFVNPVNNAVKERIDVRTAPVKEVVDVSATEVNPPAKRVSKFKSMRQQK